jgi:DNA-binding GntR family transcriptional regulator
VTALQDTGQPRIQRDLLGNKVADALRREILLGLIKPGTKLSQQQLCDRFGTSRMPVRDGLRVLTNEGLLVTDSAQHTIVAPLSRLDIVDSYLIEGVLGGMAAERASATATPEDLDRLEAFHQRMLHDASHGIYSEMASLNWNLHRAINKLAGSRKLLSALKKVSLDLPRDFLTQMPEWSDQSNREHEAVLEAMRARNHRAAGTRMREHLVNSASGLITYLETAGLELD